VIHTGNYLGDNWVIHSSGQGVYVLPLKGGWLRSVRLGPSGPAVTR
jgi:cell wall-associated NlpC family hydrolase